MKTLINFKLIVLRIQFWLQYNKKHTPLNGFENMKEHHTSSYELYDRL